MGFTLSRKKLKKAGRMAVRATGWTLACCLTLCLAGYGALLTPWAKRALADAATNYCARELGWKADIATPGGLVPFSLGLPSLRLADKDGPWLNAEGVTLSVAPWQLGKRLVSVRLRAAKVEVLRTPILPPDTAPPAPPSRPLAFLDGLAPIPVEAEAQADIDSLRLGAALAGKALAGRASVSAQASGGALEARLTVSAQSEDAAAPTDVTLQARLDPAGRSALLRLSLAEGPGGMAAAMAGLPPDAPLEFSLDGDGPLADWKAGLKARQGREELLSGLLGAGLGRTSADDSRLRLVLRVHPFFLPLSAELRDALGDSVELALAGTLSSAGLPEPQWRLSLEELSVSAKALKVCVDGDSGPLGLSPRLRVGLRVADPASLGLKTGPLAAEGGLDADIDPAGPLKATVTLNSPDLAAALVPLGVGLAGKAAFKADLAGDVSRQDFGVSLDAALSQLTSAGDDFGPKLARALGREVTLHADASLSEGKLATLKGLRLVSNAACVQAEGRYDLSSGRAAATVGLDTPDLGALAPLTGQKLAGSATVRAWAEGSLTNIADSPRVTVDVEATALTLDQTRLDKVSVHLDATPGAGGASGRLDIAAARNPTGPKGAGGGRLAVSTGFALAGQRLALKDIRAQGPGLDLLGLLDASLEQQTAAGGLKVRVDLSPLGAFLGRKMAGRVQADITLAASGPQQDIAARMEATSVTAEGVSLVKADLSGALTDVLRAPQGDLTLALQALEASGLAVESFQARVDGRGKSVGFGVSAKGALPEPFTVTTGGAFTPAPGGGALRLDTLEATARGLKLALTLPANAAFAPGSMSLDGLALSLDGAAITASGSLKPGKADFRADVSALPLVLLEKAGLPGLEGAATAALSVTGTPAAPQVSASVNLESMAVPGTLKQGIPPFSATLQAQLSAGRLSADCRATAGPEVAFSASGALPARLSLSPFSFSLPKDAPLDIILKGDVDLSRVAALTGDEALALKGVLKADFTVSGRMSSPLVSGRATLAAGQLEYVTTGTRLRDITLDLEATGNQLALKTFTAQDTAQGRLSASGKADLSPQAGLPFNATLALDKLTPVRMDMATATLSAQLDASGNATGARVAGGVHMGPVEVNIPDRIPPDAKPIPVMIATGREPAAKAGQGAASGAGTGGSPPYPVALDIAVDFPGRVFVRGMGLDSMWAGDLRVKGAAAQPEIGGGIRIVKGQMDFFGKSFNLARGEVSFYGTSPPVPILDMEARTQAGDLTASIVVSGPAARPTIAFTSDPAVPRDEILSRVLFGKTLSSLTPPQALQLAQAVAALGGKGGSLDFLGATRKLAGLDYLGVKSSGQSLGQSAVAAGKYVADGVYVEASQGLSGAGATVSVEVDVTRNITVESKVGLDSKTGVGVNWKFDY